MIKNPIAVDVMLWGNCIGRLTWDTDKLLSVFQFSEEYASLPYDVCPSTHKKGQTMSTAFFGRPGELYQGLPEFIADSLPDKWGSSLANLASEVYLNRFKAALSAEESITMKKLISLGTSAGGNMGSSNNC